MRLNASRAPLPCCAELRQAFFLASFLRSMHLLIQSPLSAATHMHNGFPHRTGEVGLPPAPVAARTRASNSVVESAPQHRTNPRCPHEPRTHPGYRLAWKLPSAGGQCSEANFAAAGAAHPASRRTRRNSLESAKSARQLTRPRSDATDRPWLRPTRIRSSSS